MKKYFTLIAASLLIFCISCEDSFLDDSDNAPDGSSGSVGDSAVPFDWGSLNWCSSGSENCGSWDVTVEITGASAGGSTVSWTYGTPPGDWDSTGSINQDPNACLGFVTKVNGEWCGVIGEWLKPGQSVQALKAFESNREGDQMFDGPLSNFHPSSGTEVWIFVCGLNWRGLRNVSERSNAVKITF